MPHTCGCRGSDNAGGIHFLCDRLDVLRWALVDPSPDTIEMLGQLQRCKEVLNQLPSPPYTASQCHSTCLALVHLTARSLPLIAPRYVLANLSCTAQVFGLFDEDKSGDVTAEEFADTLAALFGRCSPLVTKLS